MHRFRKKSETKPSGQVPHISSDSDEQDSTPQIPLPNDFRTSLILPDLSRRFSVLRSSSGGPVPLDALRSRLADQRVRGAENQISEEEEEMILDTLRSFRPKLSSAAQSEKTASLADSDDYRQSTSTMQSSISPPPASITSSPTGRSGKRYSNNLFGSGRFNDYNYIRSVVKNGSSRTQSLTPTESSYNGANTSSVVDSLSLENTSGSILDENSSPVRSAPGTGPAPYGDQPASVAEYRFSKQLGPSALKRASMALEQVIREFEEEADDQILMPRSTPIPRTNLTLPHSIEPERKSTDSQSSMFEAVMAISSDKPIQNDPQVIDRRSSPVPSRILPGYVPGMPRPMTPREFDLEEQRSLSTTPRATSPMVANLADAASSPTGRLRSNSSTSQSSPRSPTSPLFLQRSPNSGRFTPEESNRGNVTDHDGPLSLSLLARRRPASPLSNPPYRPLTVSPRPSTPSNIVWTTVPQTSQESSGHGRNDSWVSDSGSVVHGAHDRYTSGPRLLRSPPLPDSPTEGGGFTLSSPRPIYNSTSPISENGSATMTLAELGSPRTHPPRSITPTQSRSPPTSPTFTDFGAPSGSQLSSKQSAPSNPPLVLSPLYNSSRSSLESDGSSYHTREAEETADRTLDLFTIPDMTQSVWHDLPSPNSSSDSPGDMMNPEEVIARMAGLRKSDFRVIQEKLMTAKGAAEKENNESRENRERAASSLRKRRPSTSQSNYSYRPESRVASPPPQTSPSKLTSTSSTRVDRPPSSLATNSLVSPRDRDMDISPTARRNRDLAQALFGRDEPESSLVLQPTLVQPTSPVQLLKSPTTNLNTYSSTSTLSPTQATPYQMARNPSIPRIPQTPQEEAQLRQEVQEKINAATQFLKPSNRSNSPDPNGTISRKRISPNQISSPRLVSASTSVVDMPPIKAPSISSGNVGSSKIGSRFKKLRGTLRAKNAPLNVEEITPYPLDLHSPPAMQTAHYDPAKLKVPGPMVAASATETRFKVPVPSPPASAGPGLKGFMARFRSKQRAVPESPIEPEQGRSPQLYSPLLTPALSMPLPPTYEKTLSQPQSATVGRKPVPNSRPQTPQIQSAPPTQANYKQVTSDEPEESSDMIALRQLFEAANRIGIDQGDLTALLARSGSTSSKADWSSLTRSNSAIKPGVATPADLAHLTPSIGRPSVDDQSMRALTPDPPKTHDRTTGRPSLDGQAPRDKTVSRQASRKQTDHARRPREGKGGEINAVVRKTIIVPDTNMTADELKVFMEKSMPGRRASVTSTSSRSVHERVPTPPPPPRSPNRKRFSGPSPPLPSLPTALGNSMNLPSNSSGGPTQKSNSNHDYFYDMYTGESRSPSTVPNEPGPSRLQEDSAVGPDPGAAVELIHLANGETIWNIVNGLREQDDDESVYTRRTSFASEYAPRGANGDGLQVFVKEHGRSGSKGSMSSFLSRQRTQGKTWPETKVFYTPTEGIGRLIQDLSQNMEAGSFNFAPRPGHSVSSSLSTNDMAWTLEEKLDEMIDTVRVK